jgi:kynureninase
MGYVAAAAAIYSADQQAKAGRQQQRAFEAEQRRAEIENVYKARQAVRQARVAQAQMESQAALTGGVGGSAAAGGVASVQSQLGGNLNYMASIAEENTASAKAQMAAARASTNAAIAGTIGSFAGSQGKDFMKTIFSGGG